MGEGVAGAVPDELAPLLRERYERGAAAWPGVVVDAEQFARAIITRIETSDRRAALQMMITDDLYLACGCAAGSPAALSAFERHCGPAIRHALATMGASPDQRDELEQMIRERLLVAPGGGETPRIASYAARGSLRAWVRVVAAREAARMLPRSRREACVENEQLANLLAGDDDPELGYLKRLYLDEFKRAFQAAIDALPPRDRLILQQYVLDGLTIDQLAALHKTHRATAARWVQIARDRVLENTSRELIERLRLTRSEFDSVMRLIRSQLEVSLERVLRT